jgi:hypothetical protein
MSRLWKLVIIVSLLGFHGCYPANRISPIQPEHRLDDIAAMNTRVVLLQSYTFNVGLTYYHLPYGNYYPEGQDERGIYYRAPNPVISSGYSGKKKLIQSGIYLQGNSLKVSSPFATWIYFDDNGSISTELIYSGFALDYGNSWYREKYRDNSKPN